MISWQIICIRLSLIYFRMVISPKNSPGASFILRCNFVNYRLNTIMDLLYDRWFSFDKPWMIVSLCYFFPIGHLKYWCLQFKTVARESGHVLQTERSSRWAGVIFSAIFAIVLMCACGLFLGAYWKCCDFFDLLDRRCFLPWSCFRVVLTCN